MAPPKLFPLEMRILEVLWAQGKCCVREILETFPEPRPAYTTIQTTVCRLERKGAVRRVRKIGNAGIFEATIPREVAQGPFLDGILKIFGGHALPMMTQFAEAGKLTLADVRELEKTLRKLEAKKQAEKRRGAV